MVINGLGYVTLYYNKNYDTLIEDMLEKRENRSGIFKNIIKNIWKKI